MLFINHITSTRGAKDYFERSLSPSDYYLRDAVEQPGQWHGLGAELLGLSGTVQKDDFFRLCDNENPLTGETLTARTKATRRVYSDWTFDAPKSVSLAYELGGDDRILDVFRESVQETMSEMEADMHTRVRRKGEDTDRRTANMVWAEFVHRTTRPVDGVPDAQLHCHAINFNATFDPVEERWKAGQFGNLVRDKGYYQAAFHSRLAEKLDALGYGIEREGTSFRLAGISRATVDKFSRRSAQIEAEAERLGITDAKAKSELGRKTRESKKESGTIGELREQWNARLTDDERQALAAARNKETQSPNAAQAMEYSLAHNFERASVVTEKKLVAEALMQSVGKASVQDVWSEAKRGDILRRDVDGQRFVTTKEVYREEVAMVAFARDGRGTHRKLGGKNSASLDPHLSNEQRDAALTILNSRDTVVGLRGGAGTGKTRMMQATVKAIEDSGKQVFTFAPSAKASRGVLRQEGFATADTVERLLIDKELQRKAHGQVLWIDEAGLLSTHSMKRLFDLAQQEDCRVVLSGDTKQHNAVARGDALRLLEAEAGIQFAELKQVRRQVREDYRAAVTAISEGDTRGRDGKTRLEAGIAQLDSMGAIEELEGEDRYRRIAADYVDATAERTRDGKHKTALVVSPTHLEGDHVTDAIRTELKDAGRLGSDERVFTSLKPISLTEAQRGDARNYRAGEVIQFHQNSKGITRGERFTVQQADAQGVVLSRKDGATIPLPLHEAKKFQVYETEKLALAEGDRLRITMNGSTKEIKRGAKTAKSRLDNGDVFEVAGFTRQGDIALSNGFVVPKDYGGLAHGYVATSHASQGATVDHVLVAVGSESLSAANRQQFYVSVSRGRESVRLYTDDKEAMIDSVKADGSRLSATELLQKDHAKKPKPAGSEAKRLYVMQQIHRAYNAVRERVAAFGSRVRGMQEMRLGY